MRQAAESRLFVVIIYRHRNLSVLEQLMNLGLFIYVQPDSVKNSESRSKVIRAGAKILPRTDQRLSIRGSFIRLEDRKQEP